MAERATADRVAADMRPPNFRGAVQRLRTIKAKKERIAGITGEISGIFDTVEGYKVAKKAARIFLMMDALEPDERTDIWRSLQGLIDASGWEQSGDLVDAAEGSSKVVAGRFGARKPEGETLAGGDDDDADMAEALGEAPVDPDGPEMAEVEAAVAEPATGKTPPISPKEARERAKRHFAEGKAPPASDAPEPYTGDNSDLAPE